MRGSWHWLSTAQQQEWRMKSSRHEAPHHPWFFPHHPHYLFPSGIVEILLGSSSIWGALTAWSCVHIKMLRNPRYVCVCQDFLVIRIELAWHDSAIISLHGARSISRAYIQTVPHGPSSYSCVSLEHHGYELPIINSSILKHERTS